MRRRHLLALPAALTSCALQQQPDVPKPIDADQFRAFLAGFAKMMEQAPEWLWALCNEAGGDKPIFVQVGNRIVPSPDFIRIAGLARDAMRDIGKAGVCT
jgi:hypothetical protein